MALAITEMDHVFVLPVRMNHLEKQATIRCGIFRAAVSNTALERQHI